MPRWNKKQEESEKARQLVSRRLSGVANDLHQFPDDYLDRVAAAKNVYIGDTERDEPVRRAFSDLVAQAHGHVEGTIPKSGEYLTLLGASGSGKSRLVERMLEKTRALDPIELEDHDLRPIVMFEAPQPFTSGQAAIAILRAIGHETDSRLEANYAWQLVQNTLPRTMTSVIIIDDAQHALRHTKAEDVMTIRDAFKAIAEYKPWPVSIFFIGIPVFKRFIYTDNQFKRRNTLIELPYLEVHRDEPLLTELMEAKLEGAKLRSRFEGGDEFYRRLMYAGGLQFGRCEKLIHIAIREALRQKEEVLTNAHLAEALFKATLVEEARNSFIVRGSAYELIPQWTEEPDGDFIAEDDILKQTVEPKDTRKREREK